MNEDDFRTSLGCLVLLVAAFFGSMFAIIVIALLRGWM